MKKTNIYIKPSKRGSFTSYCGGKVTSECIRKAKNSPNKAIRKKAVFAENARKWKHQEGGTLRFQILDDECNKLTPPWIRKGATGLNTEQLWNLGSNIGNSLLTTGLSIWNNNKAAKQYNKLGKDYEKLQEQQQKDLWNQNYSQALQNYTPAEGESYSTIAAMNNAYNYANANTQNYQQNNPYADLASQYKNQATNSIINGLGNMAENIFTPENISSISGLFRKKKTTPKWKVDDSTKSYILAVNTNKYGLNNSSSDFQIPNNN